VRLPFFLFLHPVRWLVERVKFSLSEQRETAEGPDCEPHSKFTLCHQPTESNIQCSVQECVWVVISCGNSDASKPQSQNSFRLPIQNCFILSVPLNKPFYIVYFRITRKSKKIRRWLQVNSILPTSKIFSGGGGGRKWQVEGMELVCRAESNHAVITFFFAS
jgi:hypothetical protein